MPITLNYGTEDDKKTGAEMNRGGPPPSPGDYEFVVTQVNIRESKKLGECQFIAVSARAVKNDTGEKVSGFAEYGWINIPAGMEEKYSEYTPARQKFQAQAFLSALGLDISGRQKEGKTTMVVDHEQWKGTTFYGYCTIVDETYTDKQGVEKTVKKGKIQEVFDGDEFAKRKASAT